MAIWVVEFSNGGYKIRKILAWKNEIINFKNSDLCKLLRLPVSPILKVQKFPFGMLILRQKIFLILYLPFENSSTRIAISLCYNFYIELKGIEIYFYSK